MAGRKHGAAIIALALAGCAGDDGKLQIRPTPAPLSAALKPVAERLAEARAQFGLGNVALALELYRKAAREDPASTEALTGMASCYELMGRFELTQRYLEQALALAPTDHGLLRRLAGSLRRQGRVDDAALVEQEVAERAASASQTVSLPATDLQNTEARLATVATVALPPPQAPYASGPRLERMSLGEVALVTTVAPRWERDLAVESRRPSSPTQNATRLAGVRLLNAARYSGVAARTRGLLLGHGWTAVTIGDSARIRQNSLILYSSRNEQAARRLSAQLGVALAGAARPGGITVLLGTDRVSRGRRRS